MANLAQLDNERTPDEPIQERFFNLAILLPLPDDRIVGASAISMFLKGRSDAKAIKDTYYTLERHRSVPCTKWRGQWSIRPSIVKAWRWAEEAKTFGETDETLIRLNLLLSAILPFLADMCRIGVKPEDTLQVAHAVDEAILVIRELLRQHDK